MHIRGKWKLHTQKKTEKSCRAATEKAKMFKYLISSAFGREKSFHRSEKMRSYRKKEFLILLRSSCWRQSTKKFFFEFLLCLKLDYGISEQTYLNEVDGENINFLLNMLCTIIKSWYHKIERVFALINIYGKFICFDVFLLFAFPTRDHRVCDVLSRVEIVGSLPQQTRVLN